MRSFRRELSYYFIIPSVGLFLVLTLALIVIMNRQFNNAVLSRVRMDLPQLIENVAKEYRNIPYSDKREPGRPGPFRRFLGFEIYDEAGGIIAKYPADLNRKQFIKLTKRPEWIPERKISVNLYIRRDKMFTEVERRMSRNFLMFFSVNSILLVAIFIFMAGKFSRRIMAVNRRSAAELLKIAGGDYRHSYNPHIAEFLPLKEGVEKMALLLENEEKRKKDFITGLSHDMRTPLTIIKGTVEGMRDGVLRDQEKAYGDISEEVGHLEGLLENIRFFDRKNSEKKEFFSPERIVDHFRQRYDHLMSITCDMPGGFKIPVGKEEQNKVFDNLFSNAYKYNDKKKKTCSVECRREEGTLKIEVRDNGNGVEKDQLPYIFDRFFRGDASRTDRDGSGLGLSMVKEIILRAGGSISADSEKGRGTCFTIMFESEG